MFTRKKGDVSDPLIVLLIVFFLAISFIVAIFVNTKLSSIITNSALNETAAYSSIDESFDNVNANVVQRGFVMIIGVLVIFVIASSFLVRVHPVFLFLYIIGLAVTMFVAVFLANIYDDLKTSGLGEVINNNPMISYFMDHLVVFIMAIGGLSMLIVFTKLFGAPTPGTTGF